MARFTSANVTVMVKSLARARRFYTKVLSLKSGKRHGTAFQEVIAPGVRIILHPLRGPSRPSNGSNLSIGLETANLTAAIETLKAKGVSVVLQENPVNRFAFFSDPDGTPLYLFQPK
jgi:catechol 2,3-dioxygenase-like lactoylglutathione lyase family enzyme